MVIFCCCCCYLFGVFLSERENKAHNSLHSERTWDHMVIQVGRDLWRPSSPATCAKQSWPCLRYLYPTEYVIMECLSIAWSFSLLCAFNLMQQGRHLYSFNYKMFFTKDFSWFFSRFEFCVTRSRAGISNCSKYLLGLCSGIICKIRKYLYFSLAPEILFFFFPLQIFGIFNS